MNSDVESGAKNSVLSFNDVANGSRSGFPNFGIALGLFFLWCLLFHLTGNSTLGYIKSRSLFVWWYEVMTQAAKSGGIAAVLDGEDALGLFIPLLVAAIFYWRREQLIRLEKKTDWIGILIIGFAMFLHICGFLVQQTRISVVSFFVGLYGITGLLWGRRWMWETLFIFALFAFCVPLGGASDVITFPLRVFATTLSVKIASAIFGLDIIQQGTLIFDAAGRYQYEVAPACGGIRSLTAIFALALICGFVFFKSIWRRLLLVATALPLAIIGNVLRLLVIIFAAELAGQEAGEKAHNNSLFSILPYVPAFICFWLLTYCLEEGKDNRKSNSGKIKTD
ncbi:MAG: exosortase/archaeosortase family protein [Verrucomicrobiia bacterium]